MHASSPRIAIQGIFHSSHKKRARAFWTQFYESQLLSFLASNLGLQRMLKPPQFILLPLVSALLSTVHCLCHMHQASKLHSPICSHNSTVATSCAHSAESSQLAVPLSLVSSVEPSETYSQLDCSSACSQQININKQLPFLAAYRKIV